MDYNVNMCVLNWKNTSHIEF